MKILHIHGALLGGGIEAMICGLANEMALQGHDVTVCSIYQPQEYHVFWHKLNKRVNKVTLGKVAGGFPLKELFNVYKYLKNSDFDVINMHGFFYYYALSILMLHGEKKFFYTVHSDAFEENQLWDGRILPIKKLFFRKEWLTPITISYASQRSFTKLYNIPSELVFNGVPKPVVSDKHTDVIENAKITENTKILFHAGRIDRVKNQKTLCQVCKQLVDEGYDISLVIAGNNQYKDVFEEILPFLSERIRYIGLRSDISQLMSESDAMCLSSLYEGLPVTLLEALSVGCIPICTPVGGIVDVIVDSDNGLLSTDSSFQAYYYAVRRFLLMSDEDRVKMRFRCLDTFGQFDIRNTVSEYINVYKKYLKL